MIFTSGNDYHGTAKRIVSLVPSITELLSYLQLDKETIGITKFCVKPASWFREKVRIGGTKNIDIERILDLKPDLVIANKEENLKEQVEALANHLPVFLTDINTLEDALQMISETGNITGKPTRATELENQIRVKFSGLPGFEPLKAVYLIWKDPLMTVGGDTYIQNIMTHAGFKNMYESSSRYPVISMEDIKALEPEVLLLSSEPYPFAEKHIDSFSKHLPGTRIVIADGEMFSWYGSRLLQVPDYIIKLREELYILTGSNLRDQNQ